jgi:predicted RNA-binding Zn ribbon-like protein
MMRESKNKGPGDHVAMWLNGVTPIGYPETITKLKKKRILDLIAVARQAFDAHQRGPKKFASEVVSLTDQLNDFLENYRAAPLMDLDPSGKWTVKRSMMRTGSRSMVETALAHEITVLMSNGLLDRIRLCICNTWFFARSDRQRSCSGKCRHKLYEQSEKYKAKRKNYNRAYYLLKKSGKVK